MGYIALKPLRIGILNDRGEQTGVKVIEAGEAVPGIEDWSYPNIIAHLNMDYIKWVGTGTPTHESHRGCVVDMAAYRNEKGSVPAKGDQTGGPQRGATPGAQLRTIHCPHCERRFGNKGALSNHVKRHGIVQKAADEVAGPVGAGEAG